MGDKHQKPKDRSKAERVYTKAGPNSRSGGKNRHADRSLQARQMQNDNDLFTRAFAERRREIALAREQSMWEFRMKQANLAESMLKLHPRSLSDRVARLVIKHFPDVEPSDGIKRTKAAELAMLNELSDYELDERRKDDVMKGVRAARATLSQAYNELTKPTDPGESTMTIEDTANESVTTDDTSNEANVDQKELIDA